MAKGPITTQTRTLLRDEDSRALPFWVDELHSMGLFLYACNSAPKHVESHVTLSVWWAACFRLTQDQSRNNVTSGRPIAIIVSLHSVHNMLHSVQSQQTTQLAPRRSWRYTYLAWSKALSLIHCSFTCWFYMGWNEVCFITVWFVKV